mmetsp:Transcript_16334/g.25124  ORF Transcript_16334/g.25124 Transcript_16334/m.25124 type:complete len:422 (-) Transcript_16334:93-1358(-)
MRDMLSNELLDIKIALTVCIFFFGIAGGLTPRLFDPFGSKLSYANLISCGVLISAALVHLLSDASITLYFVLPPISSSNQKQFPWSYFVCGLSFILLFFFERLLIHQMLHHHHHHGHTHASSQSQHAHAHYGATAAINTNTHDGHEHTHEKHAHEHGHEHVHAHHPHLNGVTVATAVKHDEPHHHHHHHHHHHENKEQLPKATTDSASLLVPHHEHHHGVFKEHAEDMMSLLTQKNYFSAVVLLAGLGFHSVLSGLAMGATQSSTQLISLGVAILSHKYLAGFALGCPLAKSKKSLKYTVFFIVFFALLTPMGIILGGVLQRSLMATPWIADIFVCVAAGTFLYISICEIMIPEFSEDKKIERKLYESMTNQNRSNVMSQCVDDSCDVEQCEPKQNEFDDLKKMTSILLGFGLMSAMAIWV